MMGFFLSLLIASFVGTIIWMVQSCVRPITQKVFSQTWHYYAGLIPVFFLLGGSEIINRLISFIRSVIPEAATIPESGSVAEHYAHITPIEKTATSSSLFMQQQFDYLLRLNNIKEFVLFATVIWAVGAAVFLVFNFNKYRTFKRSILQESRVCDTVQCPVKVIISADATTPMVMGLWKPVVVLPDTQFGEKELAMILSHELVHLKRGDLLVKLMVLTANAVHWFNPAIYSLNKQINTVCELSCDEKVVQEMDMENRRFYGDTLLSMLEYGVMQRNVALTSSLCNPKKYMKKRLLNLMNAKKANKSIIMLSLIATIALVGSGGLAAHAAGLAVPDIAVPDATIVMVGPPKISTGKVPEGYGRNVYVQLEDGTVFYFDKDGNVSEVPEMRKSLSPLEYTTEEIVDMIKQCIKYNAPIPPEHVDKLPQKYLDEINETYGLQLRRSESLTTEELVDQVKRSIKDNAVPQVYVDALPQKELNEIKKTYGWDLQKSN
ncbi:M56 family metallopeptidase [Paenibacillus sp. GCM10027626]|uniref:M56 family metallopeptidase n=1 Tax=Paenibacillus sp. GCM10027626 TaxID=3273411 RepID=UPI00362E385C